MLIDQYGRKIDYLRLSVTERCNFRCTYCMPEKPFSWIPKEDLLSFEELSLFVKVAIDEGIRKIRITGGEPTLREDLDSFFKILFDYNSEIDIALTTNGFLLAEYAKRYALAGLKRINISLDSVNRETAQKIAGGKDILPNVLAGIDASIEAGMRVKLNCVPLKGINDHELLDILEYCINKKVMLRFIEFMENKYANSVQGLRSEEVLEIISSKYHFNEFEKEFASPAKLYKLDDGYMFGIIEPHKDDFCSSCNRLRLTAEGHLIPCLYFDEAISIKEAVKSGDITEAVRIFREVVKNKPEKNRWGGTGDAEVSNRAFYMTGG
jgi:cyclic pyranopterin phosphate synthase